MGFKFEKLKPIERISTSSEKEENIKSDQCIVMEESEDLTENILIDNKILEEDKKCKEKQKSKKNYTKAFKCDKCDKKYTWYTGLSNHKRFVHNKPKET